MEAAPGFEPERADDFPFNSGHVPQDQGPTGGQQGPRGRVMGDVVDEIRALDREMTGCGERSALGVLCNRAAAEITQLRAKLADADKLAEAADRISCHTTGCDGAWTSKCGTHDPLYEALDNYRAVRAGGSE